MEKFDIILDELQKLTQRVISIEGNVVTKQDLKHMASKQDLEYMATKQDLEYMASKQDLENMATKQDLENMATKQDLENMASKQDLENMATKQDLENMASKQDLENLSIKIEQMSKKLDAVASQVAHNTEQELLLKDVAQKVIDHEMDIRLIKQMITNK
ncbi:292aa longhypothetical protein [Halalkalibacter wakoensis JCM 9140]|uniref:Uncharacterized protein n=1 Tax=Halalkalibacter wakoensis JCM 9140 TaxID=1236970 RepID=W4Q0V7_9BACI|nr:hypothetical protein [Halalkalibacter wakoensis]GAE25358.1 292aa longhypothetical protein [Halalkalibacter wakoensis JCM 9140]